MTDQQAPQFSGPYGHPLVKTPNLDRLAESGVVFDNHYTNCPICVPARMSFMTGRFLKNIGIWDNGVPLSEDSVTWAHRLRNVGYNAALSGKMHFRGDDQLHGFEAQLAYDINGRNRPTPPHWSRQMPEPEQRRDMKRGPGNSIEIVADRAVTDAALNYIRSEERNGKPWALSVGYVCPHPPFIAPPQYYDAYDPAGIDLPQVPADHYEKQNPAIQRMRRGRGYVETLPEDVIRDARRTYYALVTYVDDMVGELIQALEKTGQMEDTIIVFFSDHGEMLGEHGMWNKSNFYEHASRVPLIVSNPKRLPSGKRISQVTSTVDIVATMIEMAGAHKPDEAITDLDGASLLNLMTEGDPNWKDEAFSEYYANFSTAPMAMLRKGKYKLNYYQGDRPELYDLELDPGEMNDLAEDPDTVGVLDAMRTDLLSRWNPEAIDKEILRSQANRRYIKPYLFKYLDQWD